MSVKQIKRDKLDIYIEILAICKTPTKKTILMDDAEINYYQLKKYLNYLTKMNLLILIDKDYITTQKGINLLRSFTP